MEKRLELDAMLRSALGSGVNYYFQPPTGYMLKYPALVYRLDGLWDLYSENKTYHRKHVYAILLILSDPDNNLVDKLDNLPYCKMSAPPYTVDNLYHYPFTIYY